MSEGRPPLPGSGPPAADESGGGQGSLVASTMDGYPPAPLEAGGEICRGHRLAGLDPRSLAREFGTPLYVYDLDAITARVEALRAALPRGFDLAYAVKANPALAVIAHLMGLGLGADVASAGELIAVLRAGGRPDRVVMTGPGKGEEELALAVAAGVRAITVESPGELERLHQLASQLGRRQGILLRLAVGDLRPEGGTVGVTSAGTPSAGVKFGMDEDDLIRSARRALGSGYLDLLGLHAFGASNVLDARRLAEHVAWTVDRAAELSRRVGVALRLVDVGGGLGIPYRDGAPGLDLADLGWRLRTLAERWSRDPALESLTVLLEPGRFLTGPAGAYLCRVRDRKVVRGEAVLVLDGGIHHFLRPALVGQEHRIRLFVDRDDGSPDPPSQASSGSVAVVGPLCTGLDTLAAAAPIPEAMVGDLVAFLDAGAYGYSESMPFFLSHPVPAEVAVRGGEARLIRPRLDPRRWLDDQRIPSWGTAQR